MENNCILTEIRDLLKEVRDAIIAAPTPVSVTSDNFSCCAGKTAKGKPCTNKRIENSEYCGMHGGNKKRKASSPSTSSTNAKIIPSHDHGEDEVSSTCDLCVQHGDVLDPAVVNSEYSIKERIRSILSQ